MLAQTIKRTWLPAIILSLLPLSYGCATPPDVASVIEVIDGDTIIIEGGYKVRYIGIDTPEIHTKVEAFGVEAREANRKLVEGKEVRLERDISEKDKYGRLLRYVYVGPTFVNAELVSQGLARARAYPPDTRYQHYLEQLEIEAREAGRGMWAK